MVERKTWVNIAVCPCLHSFLTHNKHHLFKNKVWGIYIFIKKCIRSFVEVVIISWLCSHVYLYTCSILYVTRKVYFYPRTGFYFRTCEDGAGWHLIPYRISPRSEFFSQAYKTWHITRAIILGTDRPPLARGSKFHTIPTPTRSLSFLPPRQWKIWTSRLRSNNIIL